MNNTIFRRKFGLGILIALVLAFGVQGVADATLRVSNSRGDLQVKPSVTNQSFEFSFSISGVTTGDSESIEINSTVEDVDEVRIGSRTAQSLGSTTADSTGLTLTEGTNLTNGTIYMKINNPGVGRFTVTVTDQATSATDRFEQLTFTAYAVRLPGDVQGLRFSGPTVNPTIKTTYPSHDPRDPLYDDKVEVTVFDSNTTPVDEKSWVFVDFEVFEGPGYVYEDLNDDSQPDTPADRNSKTTTTLTRLGANNDMARVKLRRNGGTNKIRATIRNVNPPQIYEVTYIFEGVGTTPGQQPPPSGATLTVSAPANATAGQTISVSATTSDRADGRTVEFSSNRGGTFSPANGRVDTGSNGVATIQFTLPSTSGEVVIDASATDYPTGYASLTHTVQVASALSLTVLNRPVLGGPLNVDAGETFHIVVQAEAPRVPITLSGAGFATVSGTTGANRSATIDVVMPSTAGLYQLYANAPGYERVLIAIRVSGSVAPTNVPVRLTIPSGTNRVQTVDIGRSATLRVRVTRTGTDAVQSGVAVTFRDSSGNDLPSGTVNTGTNGEATYQLAVTSTARRLISVVITDTNVDTSGATSVTFDITGEVPQPTQSARLTIVPPVDGSGQTVTSAGPGASYPLIILFSNQNNTPAFNQVITLTVTNAAQTIVSTTTLITDINGRAETTDTFNLPIAPGVYTIRATSGTEFREVAVTVVAIRLVKDASDSVSGDNQEGDRGEVLSDPFLLKVVQDTSAAPAVQGVPITWTVVDGDGELSTSRSATSGSSSLTVRSDSSGEVRAYLILDEDDEDNRVRASVGITNVADVFFDATGALVPGDIEIVSGNNQRSTPNRYTNPLVVRVTDENGDDLQGAVVTFSLRGPGGTLTPRSATTDRNGEAEAEVLPSDAGTYFVTASVTGVPSVRFTITVGDLADSIEIVSGDNQSGEPGTELDNPLVVEVLDEDDDPVSGVTVTFSITAGDGSLSDTSVTTNNRGRAETDLTLGDEPGRNTVRASVSGISDRVTFTATAEDPAPPEPDIRLPVGQRADTYWINTDSGTMHRLVSNSVEDIAPSAENVVSLVATENRLYWVERTASNSGRIRRSNPNGNSIQLIRNLTTAPAGITIDTVNGKLYVTTERGKIQQINVDGSQYEPNLLVGLDTPGDIAVDAGSGKLFWVTESGTVHYANVDGSGETQFASGYNTLGSIAVGAGKVFWTEETTGSAGKIHSADLDGSNVAQLASLNAAPYGISVDAAGKKLYWTNSRGKIMQSNINGKSPKAVVSNLVSLGDISVPAGTTPTRPPGTFSKYDVNKDGVVDNTDAALVADALGEANPDNPRLDVDGNGKVNFLDLLLVFENRDETNAAPTVAVAKLPKVSREEVQKQIDLLIASNNESLTAQHTLAYLRSLLEAVTPEKTRLLANYPNPFNPETWIPYQLATDANVQITIYSAAGNVVRTLKLGHQSEGYYTDRSRAAYWDGRNAIGEHVASGVYFYVLTADQFSATRKMLILK